MSNQAYIWILICLLMVVVLVAGALFGRRIRLAKADSKLRYSWLRGLCIFYGILVAVQLLAAAYGRETLLWKKYLASVFMAPAFFLFLFQCLQARKKWLASPESKLPPPGRKPLPPFFWQAVFILLPVTLMGGFGFWAILRERRAVEQEAQLRAREIFQVLPSEFGRIAAIRFAPARRRCD